MNSAAYACTFKGVCAGVLSTKKPLDGGKATPHGVSPPLYSDGAHFPSGLTRIYDSKAK
jgi:hypothetical protein